jgi:hypothetical protein
MRARLRLRALGALKRVLAFGCARARVPKAASVCREVQGGAGHLLDDAHVGCGSYGRS